MDFDKPKVYGDTSITGGLVSTPTQLNLVLVVALVSWQMNGNDALIVNSGTINSTVLLCSAALGGGHCYAAEQCYQSSNICTYYPQTSAHVYQQRTVCTNIPIWEGKRHNRKHPTN